jgi:2',3'-cyclic-nucleotide 2'-phosphodiesterase (5'-nucleotidase family)
MFKYALIFFISIFLVSCQSIQKNRIADNDDGKIEIAILQMNDVYEISGVSGGAFGNLARVSHYYDQIKAQYPCHYMVLAGDFLNPSLINTIKYEGSRIQGRQMIETLNAMDLDLVTLGNHEFDLKMKDLQKRIDESDFTWITSNLQQICGSTSYPFYKTVKGKKQFFPETVQHKFKDKDGTEIKIGFFSVTLNSNPTDYYQYSNADSCAHEAIENLKNENEVVIGLTHLDIHDDTIMARNEPDLDLILGGHDHDNMKYQIGDVVVAKADANAKTVYLHILSFDKNTNSLDIESKLINIDAKIPAKPAVQKVIDKWEGILTNEIKSIIEKPNEIIYFANEPLDGRESSIRHKQTKLGDLICQALLEASSPEVSAAILNSGSVRIDDQLSGEITGIDIFRVLPFGGQIIEVDIKGSLLKGVLNYSEKHKGNGAYLQLANIEWKGNEWKIQEETIQDENYYRIAMNDFLIRGFDIPFLKAENEGIKNIYKPKSSAEKGYEIRVAIINYLKTL